MSCSPCQERLFVQLLLVMMTFIFTVPPPMVMVTFSRSAPLYEGTTGLEISCEVTPDNTGVDTDTMVIREITGPGASGGRTSSSLQGETGTTLTISPLAFSDNGLYNCTAFIESEVNSEYILTSSFTQGVHTLTVNGECAICHAQTSSPLLFQLSPPLWSSLLLSPHPLSWLGTHSILFALSVLSLTLPLLPLSSGPDHQDKLCPMMYLELSVL